MKLKTIIQNSETLSSSSQDNVLPMKVIDSKGGSDIVKEQGAPIFTRKNVLIEEFQGDPPIVYASHFGTRMVGDHSYYLDEDGKEVEIPENLREKSTPAVLRKQDQYGYIGKDATKIEKDEWDGEQLPEKVLKLEVPKSKTASILTEEQEFEERWRIIKEQALKNDKNTIIKE